MGDCGDCDCGSCDCDCGDSGDCGDCDCDCCADCGDCGCCDCTDSCDCCSCCGEPCTCHDIYTFLCKCLCYCCTDPTVESGLTTIPGPTTNSRAMPNNVVATQPRKQENQPDQAQLLMNGSGEMPVVYSELPEGQQPLNTAAPAN